VVGRESMPQVSVGLKRRVQQQGGRGLPGCPLLATTASDNISHSALFNISPRTPKKMHWSLLPSSEQYFPEIKHGFGLQPRFRGKMEEGSPCSPHWGPSIPCTHGEKVVLRRGCYADHIEHLCLIPWEMWAIKVFISEEVKITRLMVPTSLLILKPRCNHQ